MRPATASSCSRRRGPLGPVNATIIRLTSLGQLDSGYGRSLPGFLTNGNPGMTFFLLVEFRGLAESARRVAVEVGLAARLGSRRSGGIVDLPLGRAAGAVADGLAPLDAGGPLTVGVRALAGVAEHAVAVGRVRGEVGEELPHRLLDDD